MEIIGDEARMTLFRLIELLLPAVQRGVSMDVSITRGTRDVTKATDMVQSFEMTDEYTVIIKMNDGVEEI